MSPGWGRQELVIDIGVKIEVLRYSGTPEQSTVTFELIVRKTLHTKNPERFRKVLLRRKLFV